MIEINWNNFAAKFNGREERSFERLCYHMYCHELGLPKGVFSFKNQIGIEVEPIQHKGQWVSFQAKYYTAPISKNIADIQDSLKKAKAKNEQLDKILLYTNQELSESRKQGEKLPQYMIEIERFAKELGLIIKWKVRSHFEIQLAHKDLSDVAEHFFGSGRSLSSLLIELVAHTELLLAPIKTSIHFLGTEIKINRSKIVQSLESGKLDSSVTIVSGAAGTGKTAVMKDFYVSLHRRVPFYVLKASEFNIPNINAFFATYGAATLVDFLIAHEDAAEKYVVIDSAEKLSEIADTTAFQEFLSALISNKWHVIFITRYSYLDDLKAQFVTAYRIPFHTVIIANLSSTEFDEISAKFRFALPHNQRLLELIHNPLYLQHYLEYCATNTPEIGYAEFRLALWDKLIAHTPYRKGNLHIRRDDCFLQIALARATSGHFFVKPDSHDHEALEALEADEIIKYDSLGGGYFITHDVYEEWALDTVIDRAYQKSTSTQILLGTIGDSLPMRRAFRIWLSERILTDRASVKDLVQSVLHSSDIQSHWKDQILVAVLLSEHSATFLDNSEDKLIEDDQKLLLRTVFLLRIACKEMDEDFVNILGQKGLSRIALGTVFTKPKGSGWASIIALIRRRSSEFGLKHFHVSLPLLKDWVSHNKTGTATRDAGLTALYYYEEFSKTEHLRYSLKDQTRKQLISVILGSASELQPELTAILESITSDEPLSHRDKYYDIAETILTSIIDAAEIVKVLPLLVLKLADKMWSHFEDDDDHGYSMDIETRFGLASGFPLEYYPASAFQTPIFFLLRSAPRETIDFITTFTNKCVCYYLQSDFGNEAKTITIIFEDGSTAEQHISNRLWNMYRGDQVSTHLLESIHMALEKWLLEYGRTDQAHELQEICLRLLKYTQSASITAVVASVLLSQPRKLFSVARVLFRTKELFLYDTARMTLDQQHQGTLQWMKNSLPDSVENTMHLDERLATYNDEHRKFTLENLALMYQMPQFLSQSRQELEQRRIALFEIIDSHYAGLPPGNAQNESDQIWRMYLARMDTRKMSITTEQQGDQVLMNLNPEIDPALREQSEAAQQQSAEYMKYVSLKLWAEHRFEHRKDEYQRYQSYEKDPKSAIAEMRRLTDESSTVSSDSIRFLNYSIPPAVSTVLIRDFAEHLDRESLELCRSIILQYASFPLVDEEYEYQGGDGVEPAIAGLPLLLSLFPNERNTVTRTLFLLLLSHRNRIAIFANNAIISELWKTDYVAANSIFLGCLTLKTKYDATWQHVRKTNYDKHLWRVPEPQVIAEFEKSFQAEIDNVTNHRAKYSDVGSVQTIQLASQHSAFLLLPLGSKDETHFQFVTQYFPMLADAIFEEPHSAREIEHDDFYLKRWVIRKLAYFLLSLSTDEVQILLQPFVEKFRGSDIAADLLAEFVAAEDHLNHYESFWKVWNSLFPKIVEISKSKRWPHFASSILRNYLLAWERWTDNTKEWHSFRERDVVFFRLVAETIGYHPVVLYSLSKVLNQIGSRFLDDGISWLSIVIAKNPHLKDHELETNTIYFLENAVRRYLLLNRTKVRSSQSIKTNVLVILDFLVEKGSVTGYVLREDLL